MVLLCIDKETGVLEYWSIGVLEKEIASYTFGVPVLHYSITPASMTLSSHLSSYSFYNSHVCFNM
jgi:hypothetical protein